MPPVLRIGFRKGLLVVLPPRPGRRILPLALGACLLAAIPAGAACPWLDRIDQSISYRLALPEHPRWGPCSIREHTVVWHPQRKRFYLLADVVPLASKHHPNTYQTGIHLWSSSDLRRWRYHGVAVPRGKRPGDFDHYGAATPAGAVFRQGRIIVPYSARRTERFTRRSIMLAFSHADPERLPWEKLPVPASDTPGEDDDPALVAAPDGKTLHLFRRTTAPGGYQIVWSRSHLPAKPGSWSPARSVLRPPPGVRAQELTGAFYHQGRFHLLVIEHLRRGGIRIAHLSAARPSGPFVPATPGRRYLRHDRQPAALAYSGHITPVFRGGRLVAFFWTVWQQPPRYGLLGHPVRHVP